MTNEGSSTIFEKLRSIHHLLSPSAVAEIVGQKTDTLQRRRSRGERPHFIKLSQNRVAYDPYEIADWLESNLSPASENDRRGMGPTIPYKDFGLTEEEFSHSYDRIMGPRYSVADTPSSGACTCRGCESSIHIDEFFSKTEDGDGNPLEEGETESWCRVLYFDGDEGTALFTFEEHPACFSEEAFEMSLLDCGYCEMPHSNMKYIVEIFEKHYALIKRERLSYQ